MEVRKKQVIDFTKALANGNYKRIPQDGTKANNWRKRSFKDGLIDWRMPARGIYNLVRGLTRPYIGASFIYNAKEVKVWKSEIVSDDVVYDNFEPGKILKVNDTGIKNQCGLGIIKLIDFEKIDIKEEIYL